MEVRAGLRSSASTRAGSVTRWTAGDRFAAAGIDRRSVGLITWMQARVPDDMTGRRMSLMMLASSGLVPVSQALAGAVSTVSLTLLFALPGALVLLVTAAMCLRRELHRLGAQLAAAAPAPAR